ncbi:energy transducer TonB [Leptobacterium flavescens]|uniref:Energy transducer TonB n=1 Tax=Leptobacterium flavescens TaxID=472055 RepID=A0A6P0UP89_9FLAO|nr:energy transducer TonB [Leptobacterium flavescens]NER14985.1 energy transducer TonB [Leptobacterium flavescens]
MSFLDTRHKKKSFTLTTVLLTALIILLFYFGLKYLDPPPESGISVNFGTTNFGSGKVQPKEKIRSKPIPKPIQEETKKEEVQEEEVKPEEVAEPEKVEEKAEDVLTEDNEESIRIKKQKEAQRKAEEEARKAKAEAERKEREKREAEERLKREQDAKRKKLDQLMGGLNKSDGDATGSEGDDNRPGDKGNPDGDPYASSYYGTPGSGGGGVGYGLNGRSLVSRGKVQQECNESGTVVVKIEVDKSGKVINAVPGVRGTTNNHPCLLEPAKRTAFMHKWNFDSKAPSRQIGFVVVNFKLGE